MAVRSDQVLLLNYFVFLSTHWVITGTDFSGIILLAWRMQPGCFPCGHFHFPFLCLLLLAITDCSGMFVFLLFNRRKFLLKPVKTFSWSDHCKSQFLQNLREPVMGPVGFLFSCSNLFSCLGERERSSPCCSFHFWQLQCICKLCQHWSSSWTGKWDKFN